MRLLEVAVAQVAIARKDQYAYLAEVARSFFTKRAHTAAPKTSESLAPCLLLQFGTDIENFSTGLDVHVRLFLTPPMTPWLVFLFLLNLKHF